MSAADVEEEKAGGCTAAGGACLVADTIMRQTDQWAIRAWHGSSNAVLFWRGKELGYSAERRAGAELLHVGGACCDALHDRPISRTPRHSCSFMPHQLNLFIVRFSSFD